MASNRIKSSSKSKVVSSPVAKHHLRSKSDHAEGSALKKRERLEARVSTVQKRLINKAAALQGRSVSDFVVSTLDKEARKIVHDFEALEFSLKEKEAFAMALELPPMPNKNLTTAFERLAQLDR
jgi:uncharacterized protein (DUF1778 family)